MVWNNKMNVLRPVLRKFAMALLIGMSVGGAGCTTLTPQAAKQLDGANAVADALATAIDGNRELQVAREAQDIPDDIFASLLPGASVGENPAGFAPDERFDVFVEDAPADEFFRGLVADTPFNMVVHPEVNGTISLELKNVTLNEVMDVMRDVYGYEYDQRGLLYTVYPDAMRTEIFQVDYLNVERRGSSEMQVSAGRISDLGSTGNGGNGSNNDSGAFVLEDGNRPGSNSGGGSVVGTVVNTSGNADFWSELAQTLTSIVGDVNGANVVVTPQVGLIVVRALPAQLRAVRSYLQQAELTLQRQVILETKILEVTLNEGFEKGIDWQTFGRDSGGTFFPVVDADGNVLTPGSTNNIAGSQLAGSADALFNPIGSSFSLFAGYRDFEAVIQLLETSGAVQVLSSPRISTVNNQKAVIKVGSDEFFVTDISTTTITAGASINTNDSAELTPFFSGISLDVTPQIARDGDITLHIHPTVSEVNEQQKTISGDTIPLAASTIRESDSIVKARNGQVIVLGGLMQTTSTDQDARVPGAGRVPLVGHFFSQKQQKSTKSELVILMRPLVVTDETVNQTLSESLERVAALRSRLQQQWHKPRVGSLDSSGSKTQE